MDNNDNLLSENIFDSWPNWLRWICAFPTALVVAWLFNFMAKFAWKMIDNIPFADVVGYCVGVLAQTIGFYLCLYFIIPKDKFIICLILSIVLGGCSFVVLIKCIKENNFFGKEFIDAAMPFAGSVVSLIIMYKNEITVNVLKEKENTENNNPV